MSLYAEYLTERTDRKIIENERGFIVYEYGSDQNGSFCYIIDVYTKPEYRTFGEARKLADIVAKEAKELGCSILYGSVSMLAKGHIESIKVLDAYGMIYSHSVDENLFFKKGL